MLLYEFHVNPMDEAQNPRARPEDDGEDFLDKRIRPFLHDKQRHHQSDDVNCNDDDNC